MAQPGNCNGYFILKFPDGWGCAPTWNHQMRNAESAAMSLHNACTIQCNAMVAHCLYNVMQWLHRGQDLAQYCDSKGARHGRTCGACGACGAWIKESQRVSLELCAEARIFESVCVRRRKNLATWLIYYSGGTPLHTMGCLSPKDLEKKCCEIWFIWCMLQFQ